MIEMPVPEDFPWFYDRPLPFGLTDSGERALEQDEVKDVDGGRG